MQGGYEAFRGPNGRRQVKGGGWGMSQRMQEIDGAEDERPEGWINRPAGVILLCQPNWEEAEEEYALFSLYNYTTKFQGQMVS